MSDVTAIVLTTGEATTPRAIQSVRNQTLPVADLVVVKNVTPFDRALIEGIRHAETDFFLQVDADMILHETCTRQLREAMAENIGIVAGCLKDELTGMESGVKLFRKACFDGTQLTESISPDTDFYAVVRQRGWDIRYILSSHREPKYLWPALGEHRPDYTPRYSYARFYRLGARYWYRRDPVGLQWRFRQFRRSGHPAAPVAEIAMAHGLFSGITEDFLEPPTIDSDLALLDGFLGSSDRRELCPPDVTSASELPPESVFSHFFKLGARLRSCGAYPAFEACLQSLDRSRSRSGWIARTALCHGVFATGDPPFNTNCEFQMLRELFPFHSHSSPKTGHFLNPSPPPE